MPPRTFVIDVGTQKALQSVRKMVDDFDMGSVDAHARNVRDAFIANGVRADMVHGDLPEDERRRMLRAFEKGDLRAVANVAVLIEGPDRSFCRLP